MRIDLCKEKQLKYPSNFWIHSKNTSVNYKPPIILHENVKLSGSFLPAFNPYEMCLKVSPIIGFRAFPAPGSKKGRR